MIGKALIGILAALLALMAGIYLVAWKSPEAFPYLLDDRSDYPLLSWDDYREVARQYEAPIIRQYDLNSGAVQFVGTEHTSNPDHPQFATLEQSFEEFSPTVVLVEGRLGFLLPGLMDPLATFGEPGFTASLARQADIPHFTWELEKADEITALKQHFTQEQVALFIIMRPFLSNNFPGQDQSADERLLHYIRDRGDRPGIEGSITSIEEVDEIWQRDFQGETDWRELRFGTNLPGYLGELFEHANNVRDYQMLNAVMRLTEDGERVLVVAGWSHVVRIEPVFDNG